LATTDLDGANLLLLREGMLVTLTLGDKSYTGVLRMRREGVRESWFIALIYRAGDDVHEIKIHRREGAVEITDKKEV
jgi:hypothetical protein